MIAVRYAERTGTWQTPAGREAAFVYRDGTSDWNTLTSILANDEYGLPQDMTGVALDIGAHIGGATVALALDNPDLRVIAVEPVPDNVALLHRNLERNGIEDRVQVVHAAAVGPRTRAASVTVKWGFRGTEAAEHHAFIGNSSLYADAAYELTRVPAYRLPKADWAKIDIEGAEFDVLRGCDISVIVGEGHGVGGTQADLARLLPGHDVTFTGAGGSWGFRAVLR